MKAEDKVVKITGLCAIVSNQPEANVATLRVLLKHFMKVIDSSITHLTDLPHLARAWGTVLLLGTDPDYRGVRCSGSKEDYDRNREAFWGGVFN